MEENFSESNCFGSEMRELNYYEDSKYNLCSFSIEEMNRMTDGFSEDKVIGDFQFGKVYRGSIGEQDVTVKKWEHPGIYDYDEGDNELRQRNELIFLNQEKVRSQPNLVKLLGYCRESQDQLFMVYDMKPLNSVHNLVLEESFTWLQRIKVILGFARLLDFLHSACCSTSPYLLSNIDAAHILVDKDYNPILYDFSTITGGIFPDWSECPETWTGCYGYTSVIHGCAGSSEEEDIHAFGTLVLMLISKRVFPLDKLSDFDGKVHEWARNDYKSRRSSSGFGKHCLVHESLLRTHGYRSSDGLLISRLGFSCVAHGRSSARPTCIKQVVKKLLKLQIVSEHHELLGID